MEEQPTHTSVFQKTLNDPESDIHPVQKTFRERLIYLHNWAFKTVFLICAAVLTAVSGAPPGPVAVGYGGGQTSHQSVSRPYGEHRSIVQSKAFGAAHASVSQVDNSKGLTEIQPALGANKPLPVGHGAVATLATHVVHGPLIHATPRLLLQKLLMEPGLYLDLTLSLCLM